MPLEVFIGYIVLDSIKKANNSLMIDNMIKRLIMSNDTMKQIMKYWYSLVDYNPIQFLRLKKYDPYFDRLRRLYPVPISARYAAR